MRIYSYVLTHNEADRYLAQTILNLADIVDGFLIYDDRSEDTAIFPFLKAVCGGEYATRPEVVPSFLEDESGLRQAAWDHMEDTFSPREGDWILTLDADEELFPPTRDHLEAVIDGCAVALGIQTPVREIWQCDEEGMFVRTDGFWGDIKAVRLVEYKPGGKFRSAKMGGGSVPTYGQSDIIYTDDLQIFHYGYTQPEDRQARYDRYKNRSGHNPVHINSILQAPVLLKVNA